MSDLRVPFFDRARADTALEPELMSAFLRVVRSGRYVLGPEVEALEGECASFLGVRHAIGVSSGTDALLVALMALGIGAGDEVICPAYSFVATVEVVIRLGATPVFADTGPTGFGVDPASVASLLSSRTRAVIVAHLFGQCSAADAVRRAASGIPLVEDAAQAFGATSNGWSAGTVGDAGCFSFFPTKALGGFGDGGLVVTRDDLLADRIRRLRVHGASGKNVHEAVGGNFRLDALHAALLRVKLPGLRTAIARRVAHASQYTRLLSAARLAGAPITVPEAPLGATFSQYVLRAHGEGVRDRLRAFLANVGIPTEVYYPLPLPRQPFFASRGPGIREGRRANVPNAETLSREALALPIFPELTDDEVLLVASSIASFFRGDPYATSR